MSLLTEQNDVENKIARLAESNIMSHREVKHILSFLQTDIIDLNSKERACAKELLSFRCCENLFLQGLHENNPMDCVMHYAPNAENKNRKHHGGYRKSFPIGGKFSCDVIGSKNNEYPIRLVLVYNFDSVWYFSTAIKILKDYTIGNMRLERIPSFSNIGDNVIDALANCEFIKVQFKGKENLFSKAKWTRNFRKWNRETFFIAD